MTHGPADVIQQLLVDLGLGVRLSVTPAGSWPVFVTNLPDAPDNCLCVNEATPVVDSQPHPGGQPVRHYGVTVTVRSTKDNVGRNKADAVILAACPVTLQQVDLTDADLGDESYVVQSVSLTSGPIPLGTDVPQGKRHLHTVNFLVSLYQL